MSVCQPPAVKMDTCHYVLRKLPLKEKENICKSEACQSTLYTYVGELWENKINDKMNQSDVYLTKAEITADLHLKKKKIQKTTCHKHLHL